MMFRLRSAQLQTRNPHEFGTNLMRQSSPKAEVGGSNPLGRANYFNYLVENLFWRNLA
jgi:hypothetical protein